MIENPRSDLLSISHCKQQTNPANFFPVSFLPSARKHLCTQICEQIYFAISELSQCQQPKGKGHFWGRGVTGEASSAANTEDLGRQGDSRDGIVVIPAENQLNMP